MNTKKDQKFATKVYSDSLKVVITKEVEQGDSIYKQWEDQLRKNWPSDSISYFLIDRQIEHSLKNSKLNESEKLILNYRLVYYSYFRRFLYDSIIYRNKAIDLLFKTLDSDNDLLRSSVYFKTTPDKLKKYINEVKNAPTDRVKDSLIWCRINSYKRLKDY